MFVPWLLSGHNMLLSIDTLGRVQALIRVPCQPAAAI
jgi:hypothetical protein